MKKNQDYILTSLTSCVIINSNSDITDIKKGDENNVKSNDSKTARGITSNIKESRKGKRLYHESVGITNSLGLGEQNGIGGENMECKKCKTECSDNANFCENCGSKLKETCDCWIKKEPYNCGEEKCPGYRFFEIEKYH